MGWFAVPISHLDEHMLGTKAGSHEGQQTWESLCCLVALRLWRPLWAQHRMRLTWSQTTSAGGLTPISKRRGNHHLQSRTWENHPPLRDAQWGRSISSGRTAMGRQDEDNPV
mgnify:CR=1 FL=1